MALRNCHTEANTEVDSGPPIIGELVLILISIAIPLVIPLAAFVLVGDLEALFDKPGDTQGGVGCRLLQSLPDEISLPQSGGVVPPIAMAARRPSTRVRVPDTTIHPIKQKLVIAYAQPTVDNRGLFVGALASRQDRVPAAHVTGPSNLTILFPGSSTFGTFVAVPDDFFGKLTFNWSAGPGTQIHSPNGARTKITFQRGNAPRGETFQRTVSVRITDVEGSSVKASRSVTVIVNEDDNLPPICQINPGFLSATHRSPDALLPEGPGGQLRAIERHSDGGPDSRVSLTTHGWRGLERRSQSRQESMLAPRYLTSRSGRVWTALRWQGVL